MRTEATLQPGQPGTKSLLVKYGNSLVCVRYRCDDGNGARYKTVELIVEELPAGRGARQRVGKKGHR